MRERTKLLLIAAAFAVFWFLPVGSPHLWGAVQESLRLGHWYAREHVLLCLVPAFFIAGAIGLFVSQAAVMKYLGPRASKWIAYPVAAVSGTILAVCSCTVLPLFAGIHKRGAGLGPAVAFLYSGPAINILAIVLTARVLGVELGIARAVGAVSFAIIIGLLMHFFFREDEAARAAEAPILPPETHADRRLWQDALYFAAMVGILVFANWSRPAAGDTGLWPAIYGVRWVITAASAALLAWTVVAWFTKEELAAWAGESWTFAKQILPLLLGGVLVAGFMLGGPGGSDRGLVPSSWISSAVGGNSLRANFVASFVGALMYFATLTEVPILEGLLRSGMGKGPALALLLAGPALSLPSILVIGQVMGVSRTAVFVALVIGLSTVAGLLYGTWF